MRILVTIFATVLAASAAHAQGNARESYGPVTTKPGQPAKAKKKAPVKPEAQATSSAAQAAAQPEQRKKRAARTGSAAAKAAAKPVPEAKPDPKQGAGADRNPKQAKAATSGNASAPSPAKPSALQGAYAAIPVAERMAMQSDLAWGGDYSGPIDGEFSERLVQAAKAYQTRHKNPVTGLLSAEERATLAARVEPRKAAVGWRLVEDPVSGARLGLPTKLATQMTLRQIGTRWSSEQGQLQVETFRIETGATLEAVFEQQKKVPRRHVERSALEGDTFVITGMQGLKKMQVRATARNGEVRGMTILYDQAMEGTIDPLLAPMSSAFVPFSRFSLAGAAETPRRKVEYGTGLLVSAQGHILTDRQLTEACNVIVVPGLGNAERIAEDRDAELALLRSYGARNAISLGLAGAAAAPAEVTLLGIADPQAQSGSASISAVKARLAAGTGTSTLDTTPAPGFGGAAALGPDGGFAGMVVLKPAVVAGPSGAPQANLVATEAVKNFLEANGVTPSPGKPGLEEAKASIVRVICVRK